MSITIQNIQSGKALKAIKTTQASLADANEAVDENLYWQTQGLQELKASPGPHHEAIATQKEDIASIKASINTIKERIKRIGSISEQEETLFFCIPNTTTSAEIKVLMTEIEHALDNTKTPAKIQFLETVRETAETCKELISQHAVFDDQYIPLLTSEQKYARTLITNGVLNALKQSPDPGDSHYFSIIQEIYDQTCNSKSMLGLKRTESAFIQTLRAEIEVVINAPSPTPKHTSERLQDTVHAKINTLMSTLENDTSYSSAFKTFINHLCKKTNIISPIFEATEMKEGIAQKFKDIKTTLQENKAPQQDPDGTVKDDTVSPMHKGPAD